MRSRGAVNRLVSKECSQLLADRVHGVDIDGTRGAMLTLAMNLSLSKFISKHNDPNDAYHLDQHDVVTCGYQFERGVTFLNLTTPHLLLNLARAENCGWQTQCHFDGTFNLCRKNIGMIAMGMNSMGSHYNPVSFNIVNSESSEALKSSYNTSVTGMYKLFKEVKLCDKEPCDFCSSIEEQTSKGSKMTKTLKT